MMDYGYWGEAHYDNEEREPERNTVYDSVIRGIWRKAHEAALLTGGVSTTKPYKRADYAAVWEDAFDDVYQDVHREEIERAEMERYTHLTGEIPF